MGPDEDISDKESSVNIESYAQSSIFKLIFFSTLHDCHELSEEHESLKFKHASFISQCGRVMPDDGSGTRGIRRHSIKCLKFYQIIEGFERLLVP